MRFGARPVIDCLNLATSRLSRLGAMGVLCGGALTGCMQAVDAGSEEEQLGQVEQAYTNLAPCGGGACDQRALMNVTAYSGSNTEECLERNTATGEARQWAC